MDSNIIIDRIEYKLNLIAYSLNYNEYQENANSVIKDIKELIEERYKEYFLKNDMKKDFIARSPNNIRYVKCIVCGEIHETKDYIIYGGHKKNSGICRNCWNKYERGVYDEFTEICDNIRNYISYNNDTKQYRL